METTAMTYQAWYAQVRRKMAKKQAHMILWKLRDMRRRLTRPRTSRLAKEARALKSLLAEVQAAGLLPPDPAPQQQRRSSRARPR
jgi:hypothetical protein